MIMQLLIADSDTLALDRCRGYFANRGYQVEVAADGLKCLDGLRRVPPDILVIERELLWGGGDGVLACLREDKFRWPHTVVLTTSEFAGDGSSEIEPPVKVVLHKPFSLSSLWEAIRRAQYGDTNLAARFLGHTQQMAVLERRRRERDLGLDLARQPRFPGIS
jgi:DNA-binding response OmpR family regulator